MGVYIYIYIYMYNVRYLCYISMRAMVNMDCFPILGEYHRSMIEGSLEVKLPTIWTDEKQSRAEAERRKRLEERRVEEKESEERRCRCAKR